MLARRTVLLCTAALAALTMLLVVAAPGAEAAPGDCYGNTPTIAGTTGDDSGAGAIIGTSGDDVIQAFGGNDEIDGGGGNDIICAGDGNDVAFGNDGNDVVAGGDDEDQLGGGAGTDFVDGGRGTDDCEGGGQPNDQVYGCTNPSRFVVGQSAPDIVARTAFDNRFRLADLAGQNVLIDFSSLWCGPSNAMATETAGVQANLRAAGVPFTYVLAELEGPTPGRPSVRRDAEGMSERWGMGALPVLHSEGTVFAQLTDAYHNFSSENVAYDPDSGWNTFFPTLVFIDTAGHVTDVHVGALFGQDLQDTIKPGLPPPAAATPVSPSFAGVAIENLRSQIDALTITATAKATMEDQLTSALRAMEVRLNPKTSSCGWIKLFDQTLSKTKGIGSADRADILAAEQSIKTKLGCKGK